MSIDNLIISLLSSATTVAYGLAWFAFQERLQPGVTTITPLGSPASGRAEAPPLVQAVGGMITTGCCHVVVAIEAHGGRMIANFAATLPSLSFGQVLIVLASAAVLAFGGWNT